MRKWMAVSLVLCAVPLIAQAPTKRELAERLLTMLDVSAIEIDDRDRELLKAAEIQATVRNALVDVYASRFTEAELTELIAFYSTPTGKKLARLSPELLRESAEKSRAALEPLIRRERDRLAPWIGTMTSMRKIGEALERYVIENGEYPKTGFSGLKRLIGELPEKDAWGNEFYFITSRYGHHYRLVSPGADGLYEPDSRDIPDDGDHFDEPVLTNDLKFDLILVNGMFMQLPRIAADGGQ